MLTKDWSYLPYPPNFSLGKLKHAVYFCTDGRDAIFFEPTNCEPFHDVFLYFRRVNHNHWVFTSNISLTASFVLIGMYSIIPGCVAAIIECQVFPSKNINNDVLWRAKRCRTSCLFFPLNLIDESDHMVPSNCFKISSILPFSHPAARAPRRASAQTKKVSLKHYNSNSQGCHKNEH